jgi:hypothetical protein
MQTFEQTHPWISFRCDLAKAGAELWISLGEAASKCEHICRVPLRPATAQALHQLYLAKGAAATTAIEGNTLSEEEVLQAVEGKLVVTPSKQYLKQEVENVIAACNGISKQLVDGTLPPLSRDLLQEYNRQLDLASKSGGDIVPFIGYAVRGFVDGLREQLEKIWTQQWDVVWRNFVHEKFQNRSSPTDTRQRHLALDIGDAGDWLEVGKVAELTPRLAKAYARKTSKTVQRDLNELVQMGLITRDGRKVRARREVMLAFLPLRKQPDAPTEP